MPKYAAYKDTDWICDVNAENEHQAFSLVPEANRIELISSGDKPSVD